MSTAIAPVLSFARRFSAPVASTRCEVKIAPVEYAIPALDERAADRAQMRVADSDHLFVRPAVAVNRQYAVGEDEVARLQSARQRADDAGPDYQFGAGHRVERAARGFGCASMPDSVADDRKLFAADLRAKAMQAVERERSAIAQPALERRDLAREGVEEKNQSCNLILALRNDA